MPKSTFPDSESLYQACLSPDPDIQGQAYEELWHYLKRVALRSVWNVVDRETHAEDYAQAAIERVMLRINDCREPKAFRGWAAQITTRLIIDAARRDKRLVPLAKTSEDADSPESEMADPNTLPEAEVLARLSEAEWRGLLERAPISERSRRVVIGRFLDGTADKTLAQRESELANKQVNPSHIQVTRNRNIKKLRGWDYLQNFRER